VPSLKDIRRRIGSVRKTQQITRAMRMVAGAKLRRAQRAIESARPYADRMRATLAELARAQKGVEHPLLAVRPVRRLELLVVTSDRGLCGAFNANALKHAERILAERTGGLEALVVSSAGRKAHEYFRRRRPRELGPHLGLPGWVTYGQAVGLAARLCGRYAAGEVDEVILVYSEFVSALTQRPRDLRLLPASTEAPPDAVAPLPYEIEPSPERLLATLVPKAVEVAVYRALLESQAGEHAARMAAMESATRNTEELIGSLTLQFNRARQAAITKELVEIVSGAEAL
jgi:F-type H+-transporting ATPase subunit gamma